MYTIYLRYKVNNDDNDDDDDDGSRQYPMLGQTGEASKIQLRLTKNVLLHKTIDNQMSYQTPVWNF